MQIFRYDHSTATVGNFLQNDYGPDTRRMPSLPQKEPLKSLGVLDIGCLVAPHQLHYIDIPANAGNQRAFGEGTNSNYK